MKRKFFVRKEGKLKKKIIMDNQPNNNVVNFLIISQKIQYPSRKKEVILMEK